MIIILTIILLMVFQSIYILKRKLFKDFIVCLIIYMISLVYSFSIFLEFNILQPTTIIKWIFKPIAEIVFEKAL